MFNNILLLPDEIKIKIFMYLNGVDKIEILRVCEDFHRIGIDRKILQCLDFSYNYKFTLKSHLKYIGRKLTSNLVTKLNLNGIYWIASAELRNCIIKFVNLNALHVVDTQLSYRDLVTVLNKTELVRKLAFSLRPDNCGDVYLVRIERPITHLYVTFYSHQIKCLFKLLGHFQELNELWMIEPSYPHKIANFDTIAQIQSKIPRITERIVISQTQSPITRLDNFTEFYVDGHEYVSNWDTLVSMKEEYNYFTVLENKPPNTNPNPNPTNKLIKYLEVNDVKHVQSTPNAKITALNFDNFQDYSQTKTILTELDCTKTLKKWRGLAECFSDDPVEVDRSDTSLFKKRRVGLTPNENTTFAGFVHHTPEMTDFQITQNNPCIHSLNQIHNWTNLQKLTITSLGIKYAKFIVDVLKKCSQLNCLKIQDNSVQDDLTSDLCNGLRFARNLKDFRYERKGTIPVDKLFESLKHCGHLERIYVQCRNADLISKSPIETVLTVCEHLIYFFMYICELPETVCRSIKQSIQELSLKPQQIVFIKGQTYALDTVMYNDMPMFHIEDMVCHSNNYHSNFIRSSF